ncbi:energy transducer TonB [Curvibacter delicatus]|jgi:TonB family protein|uniref:energy transducer TonB n=1 Tax=Curvibacter delicatus TaxID=80879 RepID=UPI0008373C67|nr:energy transducer TonB [Curvibacter delicatus]
MRILQILLKAATAWFLIWNLGISVANELASSDWPAKIVRIENLRPVTPFKIRVAGIVAKGTVVGPVTLRAHVDTEGTVIKTTLLSSCGNPDLDESALHAMRSMRFKPYIANGIPTEVTLVVPVHIPKRLGRSD